MHLLPVYLNTACQSRDLASLDRLHLMDCMECGCCSYICPAGIPLLELVRQAGELLEKGGRAQ